MKQRRWRSTSDWPTGSIRSGVEHTCLSFPGPEPGGAFEDHANHFGQNSEGMRAEGWGAQFLDVDADGQLDLFVAKGRLEEHDSKAGRMPPQLFQKVAGSSKLAVDTEYVMVEGRPGATPERRCDGTEVTEVR